MASESTGSSMSSRTMDSVVAASESAAVFYPSATRNAGVIGETMVAVVDEVLGAAATGLAVLEVACGSGQHAAAVSSALGARLASWTPTELTDELAASVAAHAEACGMGSVVRPLEVADVSVDGWWAGKEGAYDVLYSANMVHIAPIACLDGLVAAAGAVLRPNGILFMYGPFKVDGACTTESNAAFDASLRSRNPAWGIRDIADVTDRATRAGLVLRSRIDMPANNFALVLQRTADAE